MDAQLSKMTLINTAYIPRAVFFIVISILLTSTAWAGDEPRSNISEAWSDDVKRLVSASRLVASQPSLLIEKLSLKRAQELSAEPFGCTLPVFAECLLSRISVVLSRQAEDSRNIFGATQGASVQITFLRATDVWSDKDIENNWDVVKKWTDAAGPAVLLAGALLLSQQKNDDSSGAAAALIGSGAGLILVGNLGTLDNCMAASTTGTGHKSRKEPLILCKTLKCRARHTRILNLCMVFLTVTAIKPKNYCGRYCRYQRMQKS